MIKIYTDGACTTSNGKGGWAYIVTFDGLETNRAGGNQTNTTNNAMELTAVVEAMKEMTEKGISEYTIYTDSAYISNCVKDGWWKRWLTNGWKTANRMPVKNKELWQPIIATLQNKSLNITVEKVKAHSDLSTIDRRWNNAVDLTAVAWKKKLG